MENYKEENYETKSYEQIYNNRSIANHDNYDRKGFNQEYDSRTVEVSYDKVKENSVGKQKTIKDKLKVIGVGLLVAGTVITIKTVDTAIKVVKGDTVKFDPEPYRQTEWHWQHYQTWYELGDIGARIADECHEHMYDTDLSYNDYLIMALGRQIDAISTRRNQYGDRSHYLRSDSGWMQELYDSFLEQANKLGDSKNLLANTGINGGSETYNNFMLFLVQNGLYGNFKMNFDNIDGTLHVDPVSHFDSDEDKFVNSINNLIEKGKANAYAAGVLTKEAGRSK